MTPDEKRWANATDRQRAELLAARQLFADPPASKASTSWLVGHGLGAMAYGFVFGFAILGLAMMLGLIPA